MGKSLLYFKRGEPKVLAAPKLSFVAIFTRVCLSTLFFMIFQEADMLEGYISVNRRTLVMQ